MPHKAPGFGAFGSVHRLEGLVLLLLVVLDYVSASHAEKRFRMDEWSFGRQVLYELFLLDVLLDMGDHLVDKVDLFNANRSIFPLLHPMHLRSRPQISDSRIILAKAQETLAP